MRTSGARIDAASGQQVVHQVDHVGDVGFDQPSLRRLLGEPGGFVLRQDVRKTADDA
jgi:hypothetical protein